MQNKWFKVQDKEKRKEREIFKDFQKLIFPISKEEFKFQSLKYIYI